MAAKGYIYQMLYSKTNKKIFVYFLIALFLALIEVKFHYIRNEQEGDYIAFTSIVYQTVAVLFFWKIKEVIANNFFIFLGLFSFSIFLLHKPILDIFKKILNLEVNILYGALSIVLSIIIITIVTKLYNITINWRKI